VLFQQRMKVVPMNPRKSNLQKWTVLFSIVLLSACGGIATKPSVKEPGAPASQPSDTAKPGAGGYYLDDGPGEGAPADIDSIPDAQITNEPPLERSNKPYSALGKNYVPLNSYKPYKKQGVASWYGKRYHGKKTSSGEVYDMYAMTAAHTTLPLPSYAKVTNPANGRYVIVRINDRGPFKNDRLIDLSYAAAYKLRLIEQGSGLVEVELINASSNEAIIAATSKASARNEIKTDVTPVSKPAEPSAVTPEAEVITTPVEVAPPVKSVPEAVTPSAPKTIAEAPEADVPAPAQLPATQENNASKPGYYVQAGAFRSEANGQQLQKKIQRLGAAGGASVTNVYNDGLYQVKLGPYTTKKEADLAASNLRKQLSITPIVKKQ